MRALVFFQRAILTIACLHLTSCATTASMGDESERFKFRPPVPASAIAIETPPIPDKELVQRVWSLGSRDDIPLKPQLELVIRKETVGFPAVDLDLGLQFFCQAMGGTGPLCTGSSMPAECGSYQGLESDVGPWELDATWQYFRVRNVAEEVVIPILGATRFTSPGFSAGTLVEQEGISIDSFSFAVFAASPDAIRAQVESLLDQSFECQNESTRVVSFIDSDGIAQLAVQACVRRDGEPRFQTIQVHVDEAGVVSNPKVIEDYPINSKAFAWTFHPPVKWRNHDVEFDFEGTGAKQLRWERLVVVDPNGNVLEVPDATIVSPDAPDPMDTTAAALSGFVHSQNFVRLLAGSGLLVGSSTPSNEFPRCDPLKLAFLETDNIAVACQEEGDDGCSKGCVISIGVSNQGRPMVADATIVAHELAHFGTRELRNAAAISHRGWSRSRGIEMKAFHDLANALHTAYALTGCSGYWSGNETCSFDNYEHHRIRPGTSGEWPRMNGNIASRLLHLSQVTHGQCGAGGFLRHWVRLVRAMVIADVAYHPLVLPQNDRSLLVGTLDNILNAYAYQVRLGSDNTLLSEMSCEWSRENFCPSGVLCTC